jgi:ribosomal protein L30/L7E
MARLKVTQTRSPIGMVKTVAHLVQVEEVD